MAASLHVARYTPRATGRMLRRWRRHRNQFLATPGLVAARLHTTFEFESQFGGVPTPWRWALLCGWEDADARDEFLVDRSGPALFHAGADESWQVSLEPVR